MGQAPWPVLFGGLLSFALLHSQTLVEVQALIDGGKLEAAEQSARLFLASQPDSADAHYLLGYILFKEANPKLSLTEYTVAERYREPSPLDLEVIGADYFLLEDYSTAEQWLTKAVARAPADSNAQFYLGRAKYNLKHFEEAARVFTTTMQLDQHNARAADYLGLSYEALGRIDEAGAAYRKAIELDSGNMEPYLHLGSLLLDNNHAVEAVPYLVQASTVAPGDWRVHRGLGKAYLALNRLPESLAEIHKAVSLAPDNAPLHFLLAQALRKSGQIAEARNETERYNALTGAHSSPETPLAEARSLLDLGKFKEAEQVTRRYLELHKNSADGYYLLGYILFKKQDAKASLSAYTEAARYRTPTAADLEAVAGDYVLLKDYPDADKWFTKALEMNPKDSLGWYYLGRTKYNENRFEEAAKAFEECLKLDPRNVKAEDNMGLSFEGMNQVKEAETCYRIAIDWQKDAKDKNSGPSLDLGSLLLDNDRIDEALPFLLEAARISADDYRVHRQLGKAYTHLNQLDKARAELEQAVKLAPDNASVHFMLLQVYRKEGLMEKAKTEGERYTALTARGQS